MNLGSVNVKITALPFLLATSGGAAFLPAYLQLLNNKAGEVCAAQHVVISHLEIYLRTIGTL